MERLMDQIEGRELHFDGSSAYVKAFRGFHEGKNPRWSSAKRAFKGCRCFRDSERAPWNAGIIAPDFSIPECEGKFEKESPREEHGSTMPRINDVRNLTKCRICYDFILLIHSNQSRKKINYSFLERNVYQSWSMIEYYIANSTFYMIIKKNLLIFLTFFFLHAYVFYI